MSKGYQRDFADGNRIAISDAKDARILDFGRSVRDNWVQLDFMSVTSEEGDVDDSLELVFAKHEQRVLNVIRGISPSSRIDTRQKAALDMLAAIHLMRSEAFKRRHAGVVQAYLRGGALDIARDPDTAAAFASTMVARRAQGNWNN